MSRVAVFVWSAIVAWVCAAFVHVVDADVDGVQGLLTPSALASVTAVAGGMLIPILLFWLAFRRARWRGLVGAFVVIGIGLRLLIGAVGVGGGAPMTENDQLVAFGMLYGLVLLLTLPPAIWVESRLARQELEPS
jgi:hypothetical protein